MNPSHNILHLFRCLILIEISCHRYLIPYLHLFLINPCILHIRQHFSLKISVNILRKRHVLRISQTYIGNRLSFFQDNFSTLIPLRSFHHNFVISKLYCLKYLTLTIDSALISVHSTVFKRTISLYNQFPALIRNIISFRSNALSPCLIAV